MFPHKVTAGLPGLTPEQRLANDLAIKAREEQRNLLLSELERSPEPTDDGIDTTNPEAQVGRGLYLETVKMRLRCANPNLHFEVSINDPTKVGIYELRNDGKVFVCGMENSFMPEFSIRTIKLKRIPNPNEPGQWIEYREFTKEARGWRTVLARLLRANLITEPQINTLFDVYGGRSSANWQRLTAS